MEGSEEEGKEDASGGQEGRRPLLDLPKGGRGR